MELINLNITIKQWLMVTLNNRLISSSYCQIARCLCLNLIWILLRWPFRMQSINLVYLRMSHLSTWCHHRTWRKWCLILIILINTKILVLHLIRSKTRSMWVRRLTTWVKNQRHQKSCITKRIKCSSSSIYLQLQEHLGSILKVRQEEGIFLKMLLKESQL